MKIVGEQRIAAPRQRVWEALNDPEILRASIPGCQELTKQPDGGFAAVVEVKIGPIGARFNGAVALSNLNPPNSYTLTGEGNAGVVGSAKGAADVKLADDGGGTLLTYSVDADVSGRLAQLGGPIIDATAKQLAGKFFTTFGELVTGQRTATPARSAQAASSAGATAAPVAGSGAASLPWLLAVALAAIAGFLAGGQAELESSAMGLLIGVVMLGAAFAGLEYGRRLGGKS